jgi:Outer membrane lipoprotein carrier protein LolA-like
MLALATVPVAASARTLAELEKALVRPPPQSTPFIEYRFSRLLKRAAVASGTLEYREAGVWLRTVEAPRPERAEIANDEIRMRRGDGPERRVALSRAPQLRMLLDSLRALLDGRITRLGEEFEITLASRETAWGLRLVPRDPALARKVARIDVYGTGDEPACIEVAEPDGDASFTLLGAIRPAEALSDRGTVEARCRTLAIERSAH